MKARLFVICLSLIAGLALAYSLVAVAQGAGPASLADTGKAQQPAFSLATGANLVAASNLPYTTLVGVISNEPESLDPALDYYETAGVLVNRQIYETLVTYNREKSDVLIPMLATGWTVSPDGRTYTFTLPSGVRFHNGAALDAEDVAFSFWRGLVTGGSASPQWLINEALFNFDDVTQLIAPDGSLIDDRAALQAQSPTALQVACQTVKNAVTFDKCRPHGHFSPRSCLVPISGHHRPAVGGGVG